MGGFDAARNGDTARLEAHATPRAERTACPDQSITSLLDRIRPTKSGESLKIEIGAVEHGLVFLGEPGKVRLRGRAGPDAAGCLSRFVDLRCAPLLRTPPDCLEGLHPAEALARTASTRTGGRGGTATWFWMKPRGLARNSVAKTR